MENIKTPKQTKRPKTYTIIKTRKGRESEISGTLEELQEYFDYTFEVGHSWNSKIIRKPKTIKSFISNLQKSYEEKEGACFERTFVELKEGE